VRNFASKLTGEIGVRLFSTLFIFLLARVLGAERFGLYSTAFAFASLFVIAIDLGMNAIITREIARDKPRRDLWLGSANVLKFCSAFLVLILIHLIGRWSDFARANQLLVDALGVVVVAYTLVDYLAALLAGNEEMGWEAFLRTLCRALVALAGIAALYATRSLVPVAVAMGAASIASLLTGGFIVHHRFGVFPMRMDADIAKKLILSSLPLLGSVVFWTFYDNQDILLLHHFHIADRDIGQYYSASKIIDVLKVFPVLLTGAFFPALARFAAARESFIRTTRALLGYAILSAPFIFIGVYAMAPWLEKLLYGPEFVDAAESLRVLLFAFFPMFLNHICSQILITRDHEGRVLPGAMIACASNLVLSWMFIPAYGTFGVCYALVVSETLYLIFQAGLVLQAVPGLFNPFRRTYG